MNTNKIIDSIADGNDTITATNVDLNTLLLYMSYLFYEVIVDESVPNSEPTLNPTSVTFSFNSATGEAKGVFKYRIPYENPPAFNNIEDWKSYYGTNLIETTEDVGDMLKSNYIILRDRNYPTSDGKIYQRSTEEGKEQCSYMFTHNCDVTLKDISILYKNMYL